LIDAALQRAGIRADSARLAEHGVDVELLGLSPVATVTVTMSRPKDAADLANALSVELVHYLSDAQRGDVGAALAGLDDQRRALQAQLDGLDARVAVLPEGSNLVPALRARQIEVTRQILGLEDKREEVLGGQADPDPAKLVDKASPPDSALPSSRVQDAALAGMLGLVLAMIISGVVELVRPGVIGGQRVAAALKSTRLAEIDETEPHHLGGEAVLDAVRAVRLAARCADVDRVLLTSPERPELTRQLATELEEGLPPAEGSGLPAPLGRSSDTLLRRGPELTVAADTDLASVYALRLSVLEDVDPSDLLGWTCGLVAVLPAQVSARQLEAVRDTCSLTGWPLLGVIVVRTPAGVRRLTDRVARRLRGGRA
jgi:hypothetical protein